MLTPIKNYPAILHKHRQHRTLIIADLHLGWEINLARKGFHVPSQTPKIRQKLLQLIDVTKPNTLVIVGDIKHTIARAEASEWREIPEFFKTIGKKIEDIQIIRGNHDGNLEPLLLPATQLLPSTGMTLNGTGLFHGHTWPARKLLRCTTLIMGHVHPTVVFRDYLGFQMTMPVWIKAKCNVEKLAGAFLKSKHIKTTGSPTVTFQRRFNVKPKVKQLFIMPCFNDFLGGRPINRRGERRRYIGPVLRSEAVNINRAEVYLLDGTFLGTVEQLKPLS